MGTYAASIHLPGADARRAREIARKLGREHELEFLTAAVDGVVSVHCEDSGFPLFAGDVAREFTRRLKGLALSVAMFDGDDVSCELYDDGALVASVLSRQGKRPRLEVAAWRAAELPAPLLARLRAKPDDATSHALILAQWLGVPERTLLVDDPALLEDLATAPRPRRKAPQRKPRLSPSVEREWVQLVEEALAAGVKLPTLEEHLESERREGEVPDDDALRGMMMLIRLHLPGRGSGRR